MKSLNASGQATVVVLALLVIGSACWGGAYTTISPLLGYYNGGNVYYLVTDASDAAIATSLHVNFTPLLANARATGYLNTAYYVTNNPQGLVFTKQWPSAYAAGTYQPLWLLSTITWTRGTPVILKSPADISAQQSAGNVSVRRTTTVVGASILVNSAGAVIPQGKLSLGPPVTIRLPITGVFVNGSAYYMLRLEYSQLAEARLYGAIYSPLLAKLDILRARSLPPAWQDIYSIWTVPPLAQLPVARYVPGNPLYSPVMVEWLVRTPGPSAAPYTSYAAITGALLQTKPTNYWDYQPIIGP